MKHFIFFLLLTTCLFSCKKNKGIVYTIKGTVTDVAFSGPGSGVTVDLYQSSETGELMIAQSVTTGSDRTYTFDVKRDKTEGFKLVFSKANYFTEEQSFTLENLDAKNPNVFNESITAKAWVRLIFKNTDASQSISVSKNEGLSGCSECCSYTSFILNGVTDTNFVCLNKGNTPYSIKWIYIPGTEYLVESVNTIPLDTTDLELEF